MRNSSSTVCLLKWLLILAFFVQNMGTSPLHIHSWYDKHLNNVAQSYKIHVLLVSSLGPKK